MTMRPAAVHSVKLRLRNSESGTSGSAARRSAATKAEAAAIKTTASAAVAGEFQGSVVPPRERASTSEQVAAARETMPATSMEARPSALWSRRGRQRAAIPSAIRPKGTLIQKHQRQDRCSVNRPPSKGPKAMDTPNAAPMIPRYFPRSLGGNRSATMAWERMICPPPPSPCTARPKMSVPMDEPRAQASEPVIKSTWAMQKRGLRPKMSPSLP